MRHFLLLLSVHLVFLLLPQLSYAETFIDSDLQNSFSQIKARYDKFKFNEGEIKELDDIQKDYISLELKLDQCISARKVQFENLKEDLKALGDKQFTEAFDIKNKRQELGHQSQAIDNQLKRCNLLKIQLKQITKITAQKRNDLLTKTLLNHELSFWKATKQLTKYKNNREQETKPIISLFYQALKASTWPLLFLMIAGIASGILWKRQSSSYLTHNKKFSSTTMRAAIQGVKRTSPVLFSLLLILIYLQTQLSSHALLIQTLKLALVLCFTFAILRGVLFPEKPFISTTSISKRTVLLLVWTTIIFSIITFALNNTALGRFSNSAILYMIWFISLSLSALSLISVSWVVIQNFLTKHSFTPAFLVSTGIMACVIIAAFLGYRNFASLLFFGTLFSLIIGIIALLLLRTSNEFFDSLDEGKIAWQRKLRAIMSIEDNHAFPGVIWLRILFFFAILFISISALMYIWGSSQQRISTLFITLQKGFTIGSVNLDLLNIVYALLILIIALSILPFIKNQLISSWLKHSNLSRGAKEATQTLVGYVGIAIAILWALLILGVNFQNLAIIAGALSVGIGFGLQNIVNNFVSGLIILFERPIRRGDWIIVGTTEGYVKDISIRSTTIQTFDEADVIVPNSELVSNQVTNLMLNNTTGRLMAPIRVAYGSDVSQVIEILENLANNHPDIIDNHPDYPIHVLFLGFGDNSLNFELRCFVRNVDYRISILSDINQGIDREFRKENIEIPFPQRVVHIQDKDTE